MLNRHKPILYGNSKQNTECILRDAFKDPRWLESFDIESPIYASLPLVIAKGLKVYRIEMPFYTNLSSECSKILHQRGKRAETIFSDPGLPG